MGGKGNNPAGLTVHLYVKKGKAESIQFTLSAGSTVFFKFASKYELTVTGSFASSQDDKKDVCRVVTTPKFKEGTFPAQETDGTIILHVTGPYATTLQYEMTIMAATPVEPVTAALQQLGVEEEQKSD